MTTREAIGARVREARRAKNLSQQQIADATGIERSAISDIERGVRNITATELVPLAEALGWDVTWLLGVAPPGVYAAGYRDGWHACAEAVARASANPRPAGSRTQEPV